MRVCAGNWGAGALLAKKPQEPVSGALPLNRQWRCRTDPDGSAQMPFSSADPQCLSETHCDACRRYAAVGGTAGPLSLREVTAKETHKAAVGYREAADDPARRRQAWPPATASGRGPHFRRARNPSGAGPRGGSPGQGPAPDPAREAEGGGPTGTGRAGPGSGDPSGRTYAASLARPARPPR